jgi:hypothetical protein
MDVGNSTVNTTITNITVSTNTVNVASIINIGANVNLSTTYMDVGNSTVNTTITNITVSTNTVNVASIINVGANVNLSTSQINVGNSTVNTVITSTSLTTTSNTVSLGTAAYFVANGNVGIGTSSPSAEGKLTVGSTTVTDKNGILLNRGAAATPSGVQGAIFYEWNSFGGTSESLSFFSEVKLFTFLHVYP